MSYRVLGLALALAAWLLCGAIPARAADEPVATAPIPPPPTDRPATVPLRSPPAVAAPAKPLPKAAAKSERAAVSQERRHAERHHKKPDTAADARSTSKRRSRDSAKRAEHRKSDTDRTEPRATSREITASLDQLRPPTDYRPRRYYYREEVEGPFPPQWYERGPPFAGMPYPRGPMPPW